MSTTIAKGNRLQITNSSQWWVGIVILPALSILLCTVVTAVTSRTIPCTMTMLGLVLLVASFTDLSERKIPNWLTYSALLWGIGVNLLAELFLMPLAANPSQMQSLIGSVGIVDSLLGAAVCFGLMLIGYLASGTGAGDVKLLAAAGAIGGTAFGVNTLLWGYITAGASIVLWQIAIGNSWHLAASMGRRVGSGIAPGWIAPPRAEQEAFLKRPFPLAAAFAAGALITQLGGGLIGRGGW